MFDYMRAVQSPGVKRKFKLSDSDALLPKSEAEEMTSQDDRVGSTWKLSVDNITRLGLILFIAFTILLLVESGTKRPTDQQCSRQLSIWSPLSDAVEFEEYDFINNPEQPSIYRGEPTHQKEKDWEKLWFYAGLPIPEDKLYHLNRTLDHPWELHPYEPGYKGMIEVFHQLHCLVGPPTYLFSTN